jgi:RHS repeat-associated protein
VIEPATTTATTAAQRTWTTAYDADGQPASVTQPGGVTQSYGYDQLGDLTTQSGSGASAPTTDQTFGYDTDGNVTSASAPGGTDTFTYNDAGELTATSGPSGSASFGYNGDGLMTSRTDAAGTTGYTYDRADRLSTVADPLTGATLTYGYNADSRPVSIGYSQSGAAGPAQSFCYNGLQQLTSDTLESASGATIASAGYGYNADGDLTSQATSGYAGAAATTYGYNEADELTSASADGATTSYGYDADGDLTQAGGTSYSYDAQDQPVGSTTSAGTTSYGYTLSGALSSVTPPSGTAQDFTSNAYGQTATAPGGVSYGYDALGRLATRSTSSGTADLAYSGTGDTLASDGSTSYAYDPAGGLVAAKPGGGTAEAALTDVHGDVSGLFSPAGTTTGLAASAAYSPYGTVTATSGTMPSLGYQGQYTDPSTGDIDMSARWYAPSTGTFTSNDTLSGRPVPASVNPSSYGYAAGNPLTNTDPSGHSNCPTGDDPWIEWWPLALSSCIIFHQCNYGSPEAIVEGSCGNGGGGQGDDNKGGAADEGGGSTPICKVLPSVQGCEGNGGGGGSCGLSCIGGIGIGVITVLCLYNEEICACLTDPEGCLPVPPEPPEPPQDCHAGPEPTCSTPPAPKNLRDTPHESKPPNFDTNPSKPPPGGNIIEQPPTESQLDKSLGTEPTGTNGTPGENGGPAAGQGSDTGPGASQNPATVGEPDSPQAPNPQSGSPPAGTPGTGPETPEPPAPEPPSAKPPESVGPRLWQRVLANGVIGAATNVYTDLAQGEDNWKTLLKGAGIGFGTGALAGGIGALGGESVPGALATGAGGGAMSGFANSVLTQAAMNGWRFGNVHYGEAGLDAGIGGLGGGLGSAADLGTSTVNSFATPGNVVGGVAGLVGAAQCIFSGRALHNQDLC